MRRRGFLGSLGASVGLAGIGGLGLFGSPFARRARADDTVPKRFVVFHTPSDAIGPAFWTPPGSGDRAITSLPEPMEALTAYQDRILMVGGLRMPHVTQNHSAISRVLTCSPAGGPWGDDASGPHGLLAQGPSLDHVIGAHLGTAPLVLGVRTASTSVDTRLSYRAAHEPVDPYDDPSAAFTATFGPALAGATAQAELRASLERRASVLDASRDQIGRVRAQLGREDRQKLDSHLDLLRSLETRVARDAAGLYTCSPEPLALDGGFDHRDPAFATRTAGLQMDVLTSALACGTTQVVTLQVGTSGDTFDARPGEGFASHIVAPELGIDLGAHLGEHVDLIHPFDPATSPALLRSQRLDLERIYYGLFASLLGKLDAIPEGTGTLLDHTVVLWCKSLGNGISHRADDLLFMLAGGSALGVSTGRFLDRAEQPINPLHASVANLFGMELDTFGDPTWGDVGSCCSDPSWATMGPMELG